MNTRFDPELSRLAFEDRLIEFCEDSATPLLERVRLLAIISERMDVFFMTRVGRLKQIMAAEQDAAKAARAREQMTLVAGEAHRMMRRTYRLLDEVLKLLAGHGIAIERWTALDEVSRHQLREAHGLRLSKTIRTAIIEPSRSLPHVRNLRPALFAHGIRDGSGSACTAVVELPDDVPRLVAVPGGRRFVPLEQLIAAELPALCPELRVEDIHLFRVTRNGHSEFDDDENVFEAVAEEVEQRPFQDVVRLEVDHAMPPAMRETLRRELDREAERMGGSLADEDVYEVPALIDLAGLDEIVKLDLPALKAEPIRPRPRSIDRLLDQQGTELLHFPFDDYERTIGEFLAAAARHSDLAAIHTTIYRTDSESELVRALRVARSRGAEASVVVELKASFDERENMDLARLLEAEGVRVVLSPVSLKVHAKVALVTLKRGGSLRRVAIVGTGNMNATTARTYIDCWLATTDPTCTSEIAAVFETITMGAPPPDTSRILASPFNLRRSFLTLIQRESEHAASGRPAGIRAMMNGLTDSEVIAALHRASQAGVRIELMVRGVCLLRPAVPGLSENIRIVSLAGLLLQHARIFHFRNGGTDRYLIGSADWRPRNFDARVELVAEVTSAEHHAQLDRIVTGTLAADDAWELGADGVYVRRGGAARARRAQSAQGSLTYVTLTPS